MAVLQNYAVPQFRVESSGVFGFSNMVWLNMIYFYTHLISMTSFTDRGGHGSAFSVPVNVKKGVLFQSQISKNSWVVEWGFHLEP